MGRPSGRNPGLDFKLAAQNSKLGDLAEGMFIKGLVAMFMSVDLLLYLYMISILKPNCQVSNDYRGTGNRGGEGPI